MALADPLPLASFSDLLRLSHVKITPAWNQQRSLAGGGDTLYADRAPMLLQFDFTTVEMANSDAMIARALLNSRAGGLKTFLFSNPMAQYPSSDPTGVLFGAATPVVGAIADSLHVAFTGFPANYAIPLGTAFQIIFDTTRYYLGQFAEAKTADGSGNVTSTEIAPALPSLVAPGNAVTVIKPACKARVIPNTVVMASGGPVSSTVTWSAEQTYRA